MAFSKAFERELDRLFNQRTDWLRRKLGTRTPGRPPKFNRRTVDAGIRKLQAIASDALANKLAKTEFNKHAGSPKNYHVKGRGPEEKKARFERWFNSKFGSMKGLVYTFWGDHGRSVYVGRTGSHGSRPSSHFSIHWFPSVRRIKIFPVRGISHLPKLECLAIHHFQPTRNKNKAATRKWTKACPLCKTHKHIEDELRDIFRLR